MNILRLTSLLLLLFAITASAEYESKLRNVDSLGGIRLAGTEDPSTRKVYIVQLAAPSAADYYTKTRPLAYKSGASRSRFDKTNPVIQEYAARLAADRKSVV